MYALTICIGALRNLFLVDLMKLVRDLLLERLLGIVFPFQSIFTVSVVKDYNRFRKFNVTEISQAVRSSTDVDGE